MSVSIARPDSHSTLVSPLPANCSDDPEADAARQYSIRLAVIVPVFNEQATVVELLSRLQKQAAVSQIIVVDDGSTDGTHALLDRWFAGRAGDFTGDGETLVQSCVLLRHPVNAGKGHAIRTALRHVSCSHVLIQDADLEYNPEDIGKLWSVMQTGKAECVYGSRYLERPELQKGRLINQTGIRLLNALMRLLYGVTVTDEATCYKMFRTNDLHRMNLISRRFEFCAEVTAKASRMGLRICDVMIRYSPRSADAGKKIRWTDGVHCLWVLIKWRFMPLRLTLP